MTAREILIRVLNQTSSDFLDHEFGPDEEIGSIAGYILAARTAEDANELEAREADAYPGVIYGAIRRMRAGYYANLLRQTIDETRGAR